MRRERDRLPTLAPATALLLALGAALAAGCGDAAGRELEPELRVRVEGRPLGAWIEDAEQGRVEVEDAARAARALATARAVDDFAIRHRACDAAVTLSKQYDAAVAGLVPWLSVDGRDATTATWALAERTPDVADAVPAVVDLLDSPDDEVRGRATAALRDAAATASARLEALLASGSTRERAAAAGLLSRYAGKQAIDAEARERLAPAVVAALVDLLHDDDALVRRGAAPCIGAWGAAAAGATPALMTALDTETDTYTRTYILQSVAAVHALPDTPVPARFAGQLAHLALDPDEDASAAANAVRALQAVAGAPSVVPEAARRTVADARSGEGAQRTRAVRLLGALATRENGGIDALVATLDDADAALRREAVGALATLGDGGADVLSALRALHDRTTDDAELRSVIATTLRRLGGE